MNRISTIFGSVTLGLAALVIVNLIFFGIVVGLDIAFGEAPEFTVPLLVPILICLGLLLTMLKLSGASAFKIGVSIPI